MRLRNWCRCVEWFEDVPCEDFITRTISDTISCVRHTIGCNLFLFQAHSQNAPVTIAYSAKTPPDTTASDTGTNTGLVVMLKAWDTDSTTYVHNSNIDNVTVLLVVSLHGSKDPVPGGCNMEFPVEVSPFLRLVMKTTELAVEFQHASGGVPREAQAPKCSRNLPFFRYDLYVYYLDQWDLSEEALPGGCL
ncbi:hypothetical protein HPB51_004201 [Rhipicephalus microplus]|uniref:Uncharacterized protein n=1 Tax=Rhipicephalus microplus TaxID=6941 RepID=A0A9J6DT82_RHIMP|nr:hypothetical protein HPB51_004201 [Rhipicephalus microplus]